MNAIASSILNFQDYVQRLAVTMVLQMPVLSTRNQLLQNTAACANASKIR